MFKSLKLTDILVTVVIAVVFAIVYKLWSPLYYAVKPWGFQVDQLLYPMWFMAATVAFLIIRKPGVALIAELAAASGEFITGSEWGVSVFMAGILQGLFAELVFAAFRYKNYSLVVASLAGIGASVGSLLMDLYYNYIDDLSVWNVTILLASRMVGSVIICGIFAYYLVKALEATGVTNLVRPPSKADYDLLNRP
ncbi:MAG: thiamine transporter permease [Paenibacillus sp.]|nr:thiamine transporter permease [Paenibacillus sp.]